MCDLEYLVNHREETYVSIFKVESLRRGSKARQPNLASALTDGSRSVPSSGIKKKLWDNDDVDD